MKFIPELFVSFYSFGLFRNVRVYHSKSLPMYFGFRWNCNLKRQIATTFYPRWVYSSWRNHDISCYKEYTLCSIWHNNFYTTNKLVIALNIVFSLRRLYSPYHAIILPFLHDEYTRREEIMISLVTKSILFVAFDIIISIRRINSS